MPDEASRRNEAPFLPHRAGALARASAPTRIIQDDLASRQRLISGTLLADIREREKLISDSFFADLRKQQKLMAGNVLDGIRKQEKLISDSFFADLRKQQKLMAGNVLDGIRKQEKLISDSFFADLRKQQKLMAGNVLGDLAGQQRLVSETLLAGLKVLTPQLVGVPAPTDDGPIDPVSGRGAEPGFGEWYTSLAPRDRRHVRNSLIAFFLALAYFVTHPGAFEATGCIVALLCVMSAIDDALDD